MLNAGRARQDISPKQPMFLVGYPHVERTSTGIHDPLYASALYLSNDEESILCISTDLLFVHHQLAADCRQRICRKTRVPAENIMISATHTHSAPVTCSVLAWQGDPIVPPPDPEYLKQVSEGIVTAGVQAVENASPAELASTFAAVDGVGCNRLDPDGPRDPDAGILVVRRSSDKCVTALQVCYSMHPTVIHEDIRQVTSDFPGFCRRSLESEFPHAMVIYHTGPCGNLSPRHHVRNQTFDEADRLGFRLADCINKALSRIPDTAFSSDPEIRAATKQCELTARKFVSVNAARDHLEEAQKKYARLKNSNAPRPRVRTAECELFGAEEQVTLASAQADGQIARLHKEYLHAEIQVLRAGDTFLACFPGELFVEYALELKSSAGKDVFPVSLANGELQGYITTPDASGYEASLSMFTPESGSRMIQTALNLITDGQCRN